MLTSEISSSKDLKKSNVFFRYRPQPGKLFFKKKPMYLAQPSNPLIMQKNFWFLLLLFSTVVRLMALTALVLRTLWPEPSACPRFHDLIGVKFPILGRNVSCFLLGWGFAPECVSRITPSRIRTGTDRGRNREDHQCKYRKEWCTIPEICSLDTIRNEFFSCYQQILIIEFSLTYFCKIVPVPK